MQTETVYYSVLCNYLGALPVKLMFFRIRENSLTASQENPAKLYDERCSTCALKFLYIENRLHYKIFPLPFESNDTDEDDDEIRPETFDEYSALRNLMLKKKIYILLGLSENSPQNVARGQSRGFRKQLQMDVYTEENTLLKTVVFQSPSNAEWADLLLMSKTVTPSAQYETPLAPFWIKHISEWIKTNIKDGITPSSQVSQAQGAISPGGQGFGRLTMKQNGCRELPQGSKKLLLPQTSLLDNSICLGLVDAGSYSGKPALHLEAYNWFETHKLLLQERVVSIVKLQLLNVLMSSAVHITGKGIEKAFSRYRAHKAPTGVGETALVEVVVDNSVVRPKPATNPETLISAGVSLYRASSNTGVRMRTQRGIQVSGDGGRTVTLRDLRPTKDQRKFHNDEYLAVMGPLKEKTKTYGRMKDWYHGTIEDQEALRRLNSVLGFRARGTYLIYKSPTDNQYYLLVANTTKAIYKVLIEKTATAKYFFKPEHDQLQSAGKKPAQSIRSLVKSVRGLTGKDLWVEKAVSIKLRDYATM